MKLPSLEPGLVLSYIYLWRSEAEKGREEGTKVRPCVLVISIPTDVDKREVMTVAITHSPPRRPNSAIEIPPAIKRRLGLDERQSWVVIDEANLFDWPSHDVRKAYADEGWAYGFLPPGFFKLVRLAVLNTIKEGRLRMVRRT